MSDKYIITSDTLTGIGDAIRFKKGTSAPILVSNLASEIRSIPQEGGGGGVPTFIGTTEDWNALSVEQKTQYTSAILTDDYDNNLDEYVKKIDVGTASAKNFTTYVRPNVHDLVESNAVYNAINSALSSVFQVKGELSCAELTNDLLIPENVGTVYLMSDSGETSELFVNGAGITINVNDSVGIIRAGQNIILFNYMGSVLDLHEYQKKDLTTTLVIGGVTRTTVEDALGALLAQVTPVGIIQAYGASTPPNGYLLCNGAEVSRTTYSNLYSVIGDTFGTPSDNTKFCLPNIQESPFNYIIKY